jgi:hypothetical protein
MAIAPLKERCLLGIDPGLTIAAARDARNQADSGQPD